VIAGGNYWLKKTDARCVLISDSSQACNVTIVSAAAEYLYSGVSDTVIECETGGSIRLALIAVLGFIIIPIPFLLCCVDGEAGHLEAIAFALKHGIASSPVVPIDCDCRHYDLGSGGSNMSDAMRCPRLCTCIPCNCHLLECRYMVATTDADSPVPAWFIAGMTMAVMRPFNEEKVKRTEEVRRCVALDLE
jgi:hypothetical protein